MFQKIFTYLQYGTHFCGIEHTRLDGEEIIYATVLKKLKNTLDLESSLEDSSVESISKKLAKNQHAVLIINNNNVLSKQIESSQNEDLKLVYNAFPNIILDDFYFEILSEGDSHFISLCRKNYVDKLIESYSKNKIAIIDVSLGNNLVSVIKPFLNSKKVYSSNASISISNTITQIVKSAIQNQEYNINGITVSSLNLLSFSGALQSVLKNNLTATNYETQKEELINTYKQTRFSKVFVKFSGLFVLTLMLINFFVFSHYFNKTNDLRQISLINNTAKNKITLLNETVLKKQKMVDDVLKSNTSKSSFYANTVIESLPNTILLTEFNYQPLQKRIKEQKDILLNINTISINGTSSNSDTFSIWLANLENLKWVTNVSISNYKAATNNKSNFSITISISDD